METLRTATMTHMYRHNRQYVMKVLLHGENAGYVTYAGYRLTADTLPPGLEFLRARKVADQFGPARRLASKIDVVCASTETAGRPIQRRDGTETFTLSRPVVEALRVVGVRTTMEVNFERQFDELAITGLRRYDHRIETSHFYRRYPLDVVRAELATPGAGARLLRTFDAFDARAVATFGVRHAKALEPNQGIWTRLDVDLRGLALPWVPPFIRDAPAPEVV